DPVDQVKAQNPQGYGPKIQEFNSLKKILVRPQGQDTGIDKEERHATEPVHQQGGDHLFGTGIVLPLDHIALIGIAPDPPRQEEIVEHAQQIEPQVGALGEGRPDLVEIQVQPKGGQTLGDHKEQQGKKELERAGLFQDVHDLGQGDLGENKIDQGRTDRQF